MRPRSPARRRAPLWFELALVVAIGGALRLADLHPHTDDALQLAWWQFIVILAQAVWTGVQTVATVTLATLHWIVLGLQAFGRILYNGLRILGVTVKTGFLKAWEFTRNLYDHVLKPAWQKLWKFVDAVKDTLERVLGPVFDVLRRIRTELLSFYTKWIRPILDTIGIARKVLRVFSKLGLDWARKLDAQLAILEEKIDAPFRFLLAKLNEVINLVNRVVTANGLFQRLALVRSIERDIRYVSRAFMNWRSVPLTSEDYAQIHATARVPTIAQVIADTSEGLETQSGPYGAFIREMVAQWRIDLSGR